jgi:hypothetical protein
MKYYITYIWPAGSRVRLNALYASRLRNGDGPQMRRAGTVLGHSRDFSKRRIAWDGLRSFDTQPVEFLMAAE